MYRKATHCMCRIYMSIEISSNEHGIEAPVAVPVSNRVSMGRLASFAVDTRGFSEGVSQPAIIHPSEIYGSQAWHEARRSLRYRPAMTIEATDSTVEL